MKHLLNTLSLLFIVGTALSQKKDDTFFKEKPPHIPPAIFAASMPPCIVGVANRYGTDIGISKRTLESARDFIKEAKQTVPLFKKQVRDLEIAIMKAEKEERYEEYEKLLSELSELKIKASLFHLGLVKRARKTFDQEDVKKLDEFIVANRDAFLEAVRL